MVCTVTDASFCNETIEIDGIPEPGRSQQGYIVGLAPADVVNLPRGNDSSDFMELDAHQTRVPFDPHG